MAKPGLVSMLPGLEGWGNAKPEGFNSFFGDLLGGGREMPMDDGPVASTPYVKPHPGTGVMPAPSNGPGVGKPHPGTGVMPTRPNYLNSLFQRAVQGFYK